MVTPLHPRSKAKSSYLTHFLLGGVVLEVHRLGNGVVGVLLEGCLHFDVVLRRHIVRGHEDLFEVLWDLADIVQRAAVCDLP